MKGLLSLMILLSAAGYTAAAEEYSIDAAHTQVGFSVKHMVIATVRGHFKEFSGTVFYDEIDITRSRIEGVIKTASIYTDNEQRDEHLRTSDFFDAAQYPEIRYKSKKILKRNDEWVAVGDLTIRGVTREVELTFTVSEPIVDPYGNARIGVEARGKINRQDFGVAWSKKLDSGGLVVGDEVKLELAGEFIKKK
ncbi:MAG TPA: YceI family protein [bacterium]|nr:YceI family protein [bacterium]HPN34425.1 YceI family protein [bacterium]